MARLFFSQRSWQRPRWAFGPASVEGRFPLGAAHRSALHASGIAEIEGEYARKLTKFYTRRALAMSEHLKSTQHHFEGIGQ